MSYMDINTSANLISSLKNNLCMERLVAKVKDRTNNFTRPWYQNLTHQIELCQLYPNGPCISWRVWSCTPAVCSRSLQADRHHRRQRYYHPERGPALGNACYTEISSPTAVTCRYCQSNNLCYSSLWYQGANLYLKNVSSILSHLVCGKSPTATSILLRPSHSWMTSLKCIHMQSLTIITILTGINK